jgi:cytochrome c oxidase assembly factor CtaG
MATNFDAVLASWTAQPWLAVSLCVAAAIYYRGWSKLRQRDALRWSGARLASFIGALATVYIALASPIESFSSLLLQVHMLQHLLLTMLIPPLVWLGAPMLPMLFGVPGEVRRYWIVPLLRWPWLRRVMSIATHPICALCLFVLVTWVWHFPALYQLALENESWHVVQHVCFLTAGLLFWYPVVRPFPARPAWLLWLLIPLLLLADVQNTVFAALVTFSDHVWYPHYEAMPRLGGISAIEDQSAAGVLMWVPGSIAFLLPLAWIGLQLMQMGSGEWGMGNRHFSRARSRRDLRVPKTPRSALHTPHFDLLRLPIFGHILRSRHTRPVVQFLVLLVVIAVIVDGLFGPPIGPMNLAGVVPWIHWRGIVIIGLLVAGNLFCYGCPFMLPRSVARTVFRNFGKQSWPRWLRTKWLAVGFVAIFLWAYETFALWDSPWLTAWIALAYLLGALVIDSVFRDAAFCKYVCPIGQFNFVQSLVSPLEVRVREPGVCTSCRTHECIRGTVGNNSLPILSGCEMKLFQPRKSGNLDCTFCLDCVQACPHENVGVIVTTPVKNLWHDGPRSGIGRLSRRLDYAGLATVLVFGAFANAAGMVRPVVEMERQFGAVLAASSMAMPNTVFYGLALLVLPVATIGCAARASRWLGSQNQAVRNLPLREIACRFVWSLVPLGFAMWLAHYSFHFFTSFETIVPAAQRFAADFQLASLGTPDWVCSCCRAAPNWLLKAELIALDFGLLASLYAAWRIACQLSTSERQALRVWFPWSALIAILFALGVWILLQPMEMRGTLTG